MLCGILFLLPFLERLGLHDAAAQPRTPAVDAEHPAASGDPGATDGWWWAGPALAAGLLLGAGATLALRRRPSAPRGTGPQT
ncbi:hypothetical protein [Streptomyces sp. 8N706]|uniref:hypothetical protein n=1 Tax=Streptomyces sp. 8N706 TaxID=3457416 RepID=UPI003FD50F3B